MRGNVRRVTERHRAHPFADLLGFELLERRPGYSRWRMTATAAHLNPNEVVHGGAIYALADTAMGAALFPALEKGERCATVEVKINYFRPAQPGELVCVSELVHKGRTLANLDASVYAGGALLARANGTFAIFRP